MARSKKLRQEAFHSLDRFTTADLELVRLILRGGGVLDWRRLNFNASERKAFCRVHGLDLGNDHDVALVERIRDEAVVYLQEHFEFPIPRPVRNASLLDLLGMAADDGNRHRRLCACTLLKAMHMINHFDASEARQALKMTDQELFRFAERRIYQTVSKMMADRLPVVEFMGGRKQRASMVTKLLSKGNPLAAQLFDKMRFRVITATREDVLPVINFLARNLFPFNYVLAGESYNTLLPFFSFCSEHEHLAKLLDKLQLDPNLEDRMQPLTNEHTSPRYKVVHWVADLPLRVPDFQNAYLTDGINPIPRPILYVRAELQILDRRAHRENERGDASHRRYKTRQREAVAERLKVGLRQPVEGADELSGGGS